MVTKIVQADYVYVGLDMRATYDSVDDMFTAPKQIAMRYGVQSNIQALYLFYYIYHTHTVYVCN